MEVEEQTLPVNGIPICHLQKVVLQVVQILAGCNSFVIVVQKEVHFVVMANDFVHLVL
jgi:hypothetical protein